MLSYPGAAAHRVVQAKETLVRRWRKIAILAAIVIVIAGCLAIWQFYARRPTIEPASEEKMAYPLPDKPSLVVLPFDNLSKDSGQVNLVDGITDQLIMGLSKIPYMFVIAKETSFSYKDKAVKVQQVSEELGVQYVLEGSVQRSGDRIRITAQLIDAISGHHLWSERYDRELKDIFELQDDIMVNIMQAMQLKVAGLSIIENRPPPPSIEAHLKILKAVEHVYRFTKEDNALARKLYEEAIELNPEYASTYRLLGWTYHHDVAYGWSESPGESLEKAEDLANKALSLGDDGVYNLLAMIYMRKGQWDKAAEIGEKGLTINSNWANYNVIIAYVLTVVGRYEEALLLMKKAMRLNPNHPPFYLKFLGMIYIRTEHYSEAIPLYKKYKKLTTGDIDGYVGLILGYKGLNREKEAREAAKELLKIKPKFSINEYLSHTPIIDEERKEKYFNSLRKAGLPDKPPLPLPDKPSIAVLPFDNISGDPDQEYLSDGFTEDIITALAKIPRMFVIARESSYTYKGKSVKIQEIARDLGVRYLLEGSIQKSGNQLRITAQLIDATNGSHLWAESYDRELKEIFALQDEITKKIVIALEVKLTEGEEATWKAQSDNFDAYIKVKQSLAHFRQLNADDNILSRQKAKEALALDPNYTAAMLMLAWTSLMDVFYHRSKSPSDSIENAISLAQKILDRGDNDAFAHHLLGYAYRMKGQFKKAVAELEKARDLFPYSATINAGLGTVLTHAGRPMEAIPFFKKALRLNPYPPTSSFVDLGHAYRYSGQNEKAANEYEKVIKIQPNNIFARLALTVTYVRLGRMEDARAEADEVLRIAPKFSLRRVSMNMSLIPAAKRLEGEYLQYLNDLRKVGLPE